MRFRYVIRNTTESNVLPIFLVHTLCSLLHYSSQLWPPPHLLSLFLLALPPTNHHSIFSPAWLPPIFLGLSHWPAHFLIFPVSSHWPTAFWASQHTHAHLLIFLEYFCELENASDLGIFLPYFPGICLLTCRSYHPPRTICLKIHWAWHWDLELWMELILYHASWISLLPQNLKDPPGHILRMCREIITEERIITFLLQITETVLAEIDNWILTNNFIFFHHTRTWEEWNTRIIWKYFLKDAETIELDNSKHCHNDYLMGWNQRWDGRTVLETP